MAIDGIEALANDPGATILLEGGPLDGKKRTLKRIPPYEVVLPSVDLTEMDPEGKSAEIISLTYSFSGRITNDGLMIYRFLR